MIDIDKIRSQFPILNRRINGHPLVYLDNAATTQKPDAVIDAISNYYKTHNANIHRGIHTLSNEATSLWLKAHETVASFIGANSYEEVFFTRNTTEGLNFIAQGFGSQIMKKGDVVAITEMEHHSNIIPWMLLAKEIGIKIEWIPVLGDMSIDQDYLDFVVRKHKERLKIVSIIHKSNVLGIDNSISSVVKMAHSVGAFVAVDAAQSIAHQPINVADLGCDFLVFSSHKVYGPTGLGCVYGLKSLLSRIAPWLGGGDMIKEVHKNNVIWNDLPWKFEAGTPDIASGIGLDAALAWFQKNALKKGVSKEKLERKQIWSALIGHEESLVNRCYENLSRLEMVSILGPKTRSGPVSFTVDGIHPHDIASYLDEYGIAVRAGMHCAHILHEKLGINGSVRFSFAVYNTIDEVDFACEVLGMAIKDLSK